MGGDWPMVRGSPRNTGATTASGPIDDPELRWRHDAGARVFGTPLVVGERVFVATCAQTQHSIDPAVAIDRTSGDRLWMSASDAMEVRGTPAVADGRLYLGDLDGDLFVLDTDDGAVLHSIESRLAPSDGVYPLVRDETVFTQMYRLEARSIGDFDVQWHVDDVLFEEPVALVDDRLIAGGATQPADDLVYVGQSDDGIPEFVRPVTPFVMAVDPATGETIWENAIDARPRAPAVVDDTVFVPGAGSDPQGKRVGRVVAMTDEQPIPDEEPYDYKSYGVVYAFNLEDGTQRWSTRLPSPVRTMPAADGRHVCVGTYDGTLVTLDAVTGELEWEQPINEDIAVLSSPTIAGDVVYVGSDDDALVAVELSGGEELWRFETDAAVDSNPSVVDGAVYFADNQGTVYALE